MHDAGKAVLGLVQESLYQTTAEFALIEFVPLAITPRGLLPFGYRRSIDAALSVVSDAYLQLSRIS